MNLSVGNSKKINLDIENLKILYLHYKAFLLPFGVVVVSVLMIFYLIFPQIQQYFNLQDTIGIEQQKLDTLVGNYNFLNSLDDNQVNSNYQLLTGALPPEKDFAGIINAITYVSGQTGVAVGDFQFSLGNLSPSNLSGTAYLSTKIEISLKGSPQNVVAFTREIIKTIPIADVDSLSVGQNSSDIVLVFYYKPLPSQSISDQIKIVPLSTNQQNLINTITNWNNTGGNSQSNQSIPSASPSGAVAPF
jgi:hypothetical protein